MIAALALLAAASSSVAVGAPPAERGLALGLFASTGAYDYSDLIVEARAKTGATHLSICWVWWQDNARATKIRPVDGFSATDAQITKAIRVARDVGFHVTAFPIVRLLRGLRSEWRGKIAPVSEAQWWDSYNAYIEHSAQLAQKAGAQRFSVGSELLTREGMRGRWLELIDRVRLRNPRLELMYSANWDHFRPVTFWDALDVVGITAYWELTKDHNASAETLAKAWGPVQAQLREWKRDLSKPLVITEIGYPSLDGGAAWPWDETRKAPVDLEEQRRAYEAFVRAWSDTDILAGAYFWNWFGFGGPKDTGYTPRGKPAADVLRDWYAHER